MQPEDKALLDANVRRVVGVAALRRLRRLVDDWEEDERRQKTFAKHLLIAVVAGAILLMVFCLVAPRSVIGMLRSVVGFIR